MHNQAKTGTKKKKKVKAVNRTSKKHKPAKKGRSHSDPRATVRSSRVSQLPLAIVPEAKSKQEGTLLRTGYHMMDKDFWNLSNDFSSQHQNGANTTYEFDHKLFTDVNCNEFLILPDKTKLKVVKKIGDSKIIAETMDHSLYKDILKAESDEQHFAFDLALDQNVPCVCLVGDPGTGKSMTAALAASTYERVIVTRPLKGGDRDPGALPGSEAEKMASWLHGFNDNFKLIKRLHKEKAVRMINDYVDMRAIAFMDGMSPENQLIIVDECQNLLPEDLKMLITRPGRNSKIILLGNDSIPNRTKNNSGKSILASMIEVYADSDLFGYVVLKECERSPWVAEANKRLHLLG